MHGEEVHLVVAGGDEREFFFKPGGDAWRDALPVHGVRTVIRQLTQRLCRREARWQGLHRIVVLHLLQVEVAAAHDLQGVGQQVFGVGLGQPQARPQIALGIDLQFKAALCYRFTHAHGGDHIMQPLARALVHVHVAGGHQRNTCALAGFAQQGQPQVVVNLAAQFHREPELAAVKRLEHVKPRAQGIDVHAAPTRALLKSRRCPQNFAACELAEVARVPAHAVGSLDLLDARCRDELAQPAPAHKIARNRHEAAAFERELAAQQQLEVAPARFIGELLFKPGDALVVVLQTRERAHHAGHRTFIGDGQRLIAQVVGLLHQLLRMRGAALEAEVADAVQLGIAGQAPGMAGHVVRAATQDGRQQRAFVVLALADSGFLVGFRHGALQAWQSSGIQPLQKPVRGL